MVWVKTLPPIPPYPSNSIAKNINSHFPIEIAKGGGEMEKITHTPQQIFG